MHLVVGGGVSFILSRGGDSSMGWIVGSAHNCADGGSGADLPSEGQTLPPPTSGEMGATLPRGCCEDGTRLGTRPVAVVSVCDARVLTHGRERSLREEGQMVKDHSGGLVWG